MECDRRTNPASQFTKLELRTRMSADRRQVNQTDNKPHLHQEVKRRNGGCKDIKEWLRGNFQHLKSIEILVEEKRKHNEW